ncbi:MAG: glycosyltransferase [Alphaproteobacteria bacterium]|nr:glycosyltransferase [Alphaproteobacteria bacterium]
MEVKISVIIPVYNVEKYLARCLDSVTKQTLKDIEIICINDGSIDKSVSIVEQYAKKDKRISLINQENKGLSAARNTGMRVARGKYISFVDSDDWIDLDFLEKLYNAAESCGADAACSEIRRPHVSGAAPYKLKFEKSQVLSNAAEKFKILDLPMRCSVWNKIYLRSELERQGLKFIEGMLFEDIPFTIRYIFSCKKVITVPGVVYHYWANPKSICRDLKDKAQIDMLKARADFIQFSRENHIICDEKVYVKSKTFYKLFGILVLKIYKWETIEKYYLFGLIPFFEKRIAL